MDEFSVSASKPNFTMKLWRGERMCLVAFDVDAPEPGLSVEEGVVPEVSPGPIPVRAPGSGGQGISVHHKFVVTDSAWAALTLRKPRAISGKAAWFESYHVVGSQKLKDRRLFAR
jgi:hypothetical protein